MSESGWECVEHGVTYHEGCDGCEESMLSSADPGRWHPCPCGSPFEVTGKTCPACAPDAFASRPDADREEG